MAHTLEHVLDKMEEASSEQEYLDALLLLESASDIPAPWLLPYYQSLAYVLMCLLPISDTKRTKYVRLAEVAADKAKCISSNQAEIWVLKAFCLQAKIVSSVLLNGPLYIGELERHLREAIRLDRQNPRAHFLLGQTLLNKPSLIGGGKSKAIPFLRKARELYALEGNKKPYPNWGRAETEALLTKIGL